MSSLPPALSSAGALYSHLGVGAKEQAFLRRWGHQRYSIVEIPKRRGGIRVLVVPDDRLKFLQRRVLALLEPLYAPRIPVHGFVKARSSISNANAHQGRPYLLNLDLKHYFDSVSRPRIHGLLERLGLEGDVATAVCAICMVGDRLPQGAPTSPLLANMISYKMDRQLMQFAGANRMRYTRYADDISLSSYTIPLALFVDGLPASGRVAIEQLSTPLRAAIALNGFEINPDKCWFSARGARKEVTGLTVNEFTNIKRNFIRDLRASLFKVETMTLEKAQEDFSRRYQTDAPLRSVLRGRLEWIAQVRGRSFAPYRALAKRYNKLFPESVAPIDPTYDEIAEQAVWVVEFSIGKDGAQGTAFFLRDVGLVTADHVLSGLPSGMPAEVYLPHKPTKRFKVFPSKRRCAHRDLVILDHQIPLGERLELQSASAPDRTKEEITALGFSSFGPGDSLGQHPGKIVAKTVKSGVKLIQVSAMLLDGLSGGPVVNERYQVVGVVHKGGAAEPKQLAVHISELLALAADQATASA